MISAEHISFSYKRKPVLNDISFEVKKGDCIAILGVNGCGKTTLLSILAGARKPDAGKICLNTNIDSHMHAPLSDTAGTQLSSAHSNNGSKNFTFASFIGFVPQENPLIPELTAKDNLRLRFIQTKGGKSFTEALASPYITMLGLPEFLDLPVCKMSGGMKKRLSIGCALINEPPVLILDEPSASLDLKLKADIHTYLNTYLQNGGTILLATHEEAELDLCNKLFILKEHTLKQADASLRCKELLAAL